MISFETRIGNFLNSVSFVADKELQRRVWDEGESGITSIISIGELYSQFFDDNEIDDFINNEMKTSSLSKEQRDAIRKFRDALDEFSGAPWKQTSAAMNCNLSECREWNSLIELARSTLKLFPG